jgi:hypothetical protein
MGHIMVDWPSMLWGVSFATAAFLVWRRLMWRTDFEGIRSAAEYQKALPSREPLDAEDFYKRFYSDSGIDETLVRRLRSFQAQFWEIDAERVRPEDDYVRIAGGCDADRFIPAVERAFDVEVGCRCHLLKDFSFDSLVRLLADGGEKNVM